VIFATVGSHPTFRFDRFLDALSTLPGDELVVQYGPGRPPAHAVRAVPWMPFSEIREHLDRADKVVGHAGAGTILCAAQSGHKPLVVPRLRAYHETVDDHQLHLATALAKRGTIILVDDLDELASTVAAAPARGASAPPDPSSIVGAVRDEILMAR
jgi:UDP-N-acetylglucosamine transferase subunit ALG13